MRERIHVDMDHFLLVGRLGCVCVFLGHDCFADSSALSSLTPWATILSVPSSSGRCSRPAQLAK
jgi:hypothetical protein